MAKIEPELVTEVIPTLDAKYAPETPEENQARMQRYEQAYASYEKAFQAWTDGLRAVVNDFRKNAMTSAEAESRKDETNTLSQLESDIAASSATQTTQA
ncbi:MAG: hypothetical protein PHW10_01035 [Candidatus Peribacteraceae bacterium]|nr:hypothetical protein [Candidatus Peribacteraceae bacterium]